MRTVGGQSTHSAESLAIRPRAHLAQAMFGVQSVLAQGFSSGLTPEGAWQISQCRPVKGDSQPLQVLQSHSPRPLHVLPCRQINKCVKGLSHYRYLQTGSLFLPSLHPTSFQNDFCLSVCLFVCLFVSFFHSFFLSFLM